MKHTLNQQLLQYTQNGFLPVYQAPQSCKQLYHTHPEWSIDQSKNVHHSIVPVVTKMYTRLTFG